MLIKKSKRPNFNLEDARIIALENYGISARVTELASERDQNYYLINDSGEQFVLKIANHEEKHEILDFQNKAMEHLNKYSDSIVGPEICKAKSGDQIIAIKSRDGSSHYVRTLTFIPGIPLAKVGHHSPELLRSLGSFLGNLDKALGNFSHSAANRKFHWDLKNAGPVIEKNINHINNPKRRAIIEHFLSLYKKLETSSVRDLRRSFIHHDANDYNVIVNNQTGNVLDSQVVGVIDFGDAVQSCLVYEIAVACAYIMLEKENPLREAAYAIEGYNNAYPLAEPELEALFILICLRLCMSVTIAAYQRKIEPDNEYLSVTEQPAWELLKKLVDVNPDWAHGLFRTACHLPAFAGNVEFVGWLKDRRNSFNSVTSVDLQDNNKIIFDLSIGGLDFENTELGTNRKIITDIIRELMVSNDAQIGVGRYNEARLSHIFDITNHTENRVREKVTIHLGVDLYFKEDTDIFTPLDGIVFSNSNNTLIIKHDTDDSRISFYLLYRGMTTDSLNYLKPKAVVSHGDKIGEIKSIFKDVDSNSHLHFQIIDDYFENIDGIPAYCLPSHREIWQAVCPDPNLILSIPTESFPEMPKSVDNILNARKHHIGKSLSVSYRKPLKIVRGWMQYLYDDGGRAYLDAINNVPHVGHSNPHVVGAAQKQMAVLNTNTRYLHDNLVEYANRLCSTMPDPLNVCFLVCSGSEANELALRLARTYTGQSDIITVEGAYHGNTSALIDISSYKFDGPGGSGAPPHIHKVLMPDIFRGLYKRDHPSPGKAYAKHVGQAIEQINKNNKDVAAFICESVLGCGGQIVLPDGYLKEAFSYVRKAAGVCIVDEVQVGFGRVGSHFWGFQTQDVVPDIVTLGKPMGNGHPLAAVITTSEIATAFANGMEYFNTYGGNPVSCAIGMAVLDVIENENLQKNAYEVGRHLLSKLEKLKQKHSLIGDVRGQGLFVGIELVSDRETLKPDDIHASFIIERMKDYGVLIGTDGPDHNVLKIKPPIVFSRENADVLVNALDRILSNEL